MQVEATGKPIRYRLKSGKEVVLHPGVPTELPDQAAKELLMKAAGKVREVVRMTDMVIEPVENIKPVFWRSDGRIIPDMVEEIGDHMRHLDVQMTAPARNAVVNTGRVIQQGTLTWGMAIQQFGTTANQTWGSLSQTVASSLARMTDETVSWGEVVKQMGIQLMTNMITLVIGLATQWAIGEAMRTAATMAGDSARVASNATANAAMVASNTAAATASTSIWSGAADGIKGAFSLVAGGFAGIAKGLITAVTLVGTWIMKVLAAIASAMSSTIFGIPVAVAILAGIAAIAAALVFSGVIEFAKGGVVTGPTTALIGEAGHSEAVIPLNEAPSSCNRPWAAVAVGSCIFTSIRTEERPPSKS